MIVGVERGLVVVGRLIPAHAPAQEQGYSLVVFVSLEPDAQLVMRPDMLAADPLTKPQWAAQPRNPSQSNSCTMSGVLGYENKNRVIRAIRDHRRC